MKARRTGHAVDRLAVSYAVKLDTARGESVVVPARARLYGLSEVAMVTEARRQFAERLANDPERPEHLRHVRPSGEILMEELDAWLAAHA